MHLVDTHWVTPPSVWRNLLRPWSGHSSLMLFLENKAIQSPCADSIKWPAVWWESHKFAAHRMLYDLDHSVLDWKGRKTLSYVSLVSRHLSQCSFHQRMGDCHSTDVTSEQQQDIVSHQQPCHSYSTWLLSGVWETEARQHSPAG